LLGEVNEIVGYQAPWYGYYDSESISLDFAGARLMFYKIGMVPNIPDLEVAVFESTLQTGIDNQDILSPKNISISVYPNPFNSSVTISTITDDPGILTIYDLLGRAVRSFDLDGPNNNVIWDGRNSDGRDCVSGVYFAIFGSGKSIAARSITMIK